MSKIPLGIGVGIAFVVGACGWAMQARQGGDIPGLTHARADAPSKLAPTPDESKIAELTAQFLAQDHYLKDLPRSEVASRTWTEYLNDLDPRHMYLLQSDVDEFEKYRSTLEDQLLSKGDTKPAFLLFNRLIERVEQQNTYVTSLLAKEKFDFSSDDEFAIDRKNAPHPKDLDDAKHLWRDYLRYEYLQEKLNKAKPEAIVKTLTRRYTSLGRSLRDFDGDEVFQRYLNALSHAYDPHTDYFGKAALDDFNIQMKLSLFGIGALLGSEDGYCKISELTPGGPAEKSKLLKVNDRIVAVAQDGKDPVDVVDMKLPKVVAMIRGPKGTKVHLTVVPAGTTDTSVRKAITLVRDEIKLQDQEAKAKIIDTPGPNGQTVRMGVIDLPSFYSDTDSFGNPKKSCTADVARLLQKLQAEKVKGIILDLRSNPGGSLQEVIEMTGLFVKKGPVVRVKDSTGRIHTHLDHNTSVAYDGPLMVLTSRMSASAAEILSGALQDYGRAVVVGDSSTYGKGTVQEVISLDELLKANNMTLGTPAGAIKPTIQKYYRVSGSSVQLKGVVPDIVLPSISNALDIGEKTMDYPMPWDTVPSADYTKLNRVEPVLADLKKRSDLRLATDKGFDFLKQDIEVVKKQMERKTVSLNEQTRLTEKKEVEERAKKRRAELAADAGPKQTVYLVTLHDIDKPGLTLAPPPKPLPKPSPIPTDDPTTTASTNDDASSTRDLLLNETERILLDYIDVYGKVAAK
jgi:carboxyl-terminal processing protease